ncbi:PilN domain-containing protein [Moorella sp. Hama-1]|uniref:PilN domain-containing protein n=1 Tax=Moorella sp. Hama-1 TaxID=2138101 RepID=UPI000D6411AE|nr:PilN domain-containing protein [Moorella sp. Hama-1]BCV21804.1 fimbrial assembly [Moorella sp. Hama-1]
MSIAINLLPPEYRPRRHQLSRRVIIALVAGGLVLLAYVAFLGEMALAARRVAWLEGQLALYAPGAQQAAASNTALGDWRQKERELEQLVQNGRRWGQMLKTINEALPADAWLTGLEEDEGKGELTLTGGSTSLGGIGDFLTNLQGTNLWSMVSLQEVKGNGQSLTFTLRAVFPGAPGDAGKAGTIERAVEGK